MSEIAYPRSEFDYMNLYAQGQGRKRLMPEWATEKVVDYAAYGAALGYSIIGVAGLMKDVSLMLLGPQMILWTIYGGLLGGLFRFGLNYLKRYIETRKTQQAPKTEEPNKS